MKECGSLHGGLYLGKTEGMHEKQNLSGKI